MLLGRTPRYNVYAEELKRCTPSDLDRLAQLCEPVELAVWNPVEPFRSYLEKQTALLYAEADGQVVAFALFDISVRNGSLIVSGSEGMALRAHQGQGLAMLLTSVLVAHVRKDLAMRGRRRPFESMTYLSPATSYRLIQSCARYRFVAEATSVTPDAALTEAAWDFVQRNNYQTLIEGNPFFLKSAYPPQAFKHGPTIAKPSFLPREYSYERGDAFVMMLRVRNFRLLRLMSWFSLSRRGFRFSDSLADYSRDPRGDVMYSRELRA